MLSFRIAATASNSWQNRAVRATTQSLPQATAFKKTLLLVAEKNQDAVLIDI